MALILKDLKMYMPSDEGEATPLCVFGNKRSVERMVCAKDVMSCFSEKEDRLDGLEPCVTDYGRQILLAQVWDGLYENITSSGRGCFLYYLTSAYI